MGWTILNLVCFAIGAYFCHLIWKEKVNGDKIVGFNILVAIIFGLENIKTIGIIFGILSVFTGIIAGMIVKSKNGLSGDDIYKAFVAQQAAKARANPTLAMLDSINMSMRNNSPSVPFFGGQQSDQYGTQSRIKTELDIQSGRAENGTNGVWLKD